MKKSLKRIFAISIISIFAEIAQINAQTIESFREITNIEPSAEAWKITHLGKPIHCCLRTLSTIGDTLPDAFVL